MKFDLSGVRIPQGRAVLREAELTKVRWVWAASFPVSLFPNTPAILLLQVEVVMSLQCHTHKDGLSFPMIQIPFNVILHAY